MWGKKIAVGMIVAEALESGHLGLTVRTFPSCSFQLQVRELFASFQQMIELRETRTCLPILRIAGTGLWLVEFLQWEAKDDDLLQSEAFVGMLGEKI